MSKKTSFYLGISIVLMLIIFLFSSQTREQSGRISDWIASALGIIQSSEKITASNTPLFLGLGLRKLTHFGIYFCLGISTSLFILHYCKDKEREPDFRLYGYAVLFCIFYACTDEFHQLFVPGRGAELRDIGIDSLGVIFGHILFRIVQVIFGITKKYAG